MTDDEQQQWVFGYVESAKVPEGFTGILSIALDALEEIPGGVAAAATATLLGRPGLSEDQRERLDAWALARLERLRDLGPEADGWRTHAQDGGAVLQSYAREVMLPTLDDDEGAP